jgi:hypothetical protein
MIFLGLAAILNSAVFADYYSCVYTPNGSSVSTYVHTTELTIAEINTRIAWDQQNFPNAVILRNPTQKYNCHSYAWYSQSTSNIMWINHPGDDTYWLDGSYYDGYFPVYGYKISYTNGDHSGIMDYNGYVISKWGDHCLMKHYFTQCPYPSLIVHYYTR